MEKRPRFPMILPAFWLVLALSLTGEPSSDYPVQPVEFTRVSVTDSFWSRRMDTNRRVTIPFALQKCEETGRIDNFKKAGGLMAGGFVGRRYNDSDVFKVMEGVAYSLSSHPDDRLARYLDRLIGFIRAAQEPDGYLYTARTIDPGKPPPGTGDQRWSNLGSSHELYNVGHMYEAAVAHYQATGKRNFLDIALKNADLIAATFGPDGQAGFPGHQEIEIGLVKLYRVTGRRQYLELARFFLDQRGILNHKKMFPPDSDFSIYNQDWYLQAHRPVVLQQEAVGHAVRATYMYSAMADIAALTGSQTHRRAIRTLWNNITGMKMYLNGGIGSRHEGEAFGDNYELPNQTAYNETCASIGHLFFNHRLFLLSGQSKYYDILERILYNGLISGISLDGKRFFYPNPLESDGKYPFNQGTCSRKPWFDCACCPVNLVRLIASFPRYIYARTSTSVYINLFVQSEATLPSGAGYIRIRQQTRYPWEGEDLITVSSPPGTTFTLRIRKPGWADNRPVPGDLYRYLNTQNPLPPVQLELNGKSITPPEEDGYLSITREWMAGDQVRLVLPMEIRRVLAHPRVEADRRRVALERGPLVYCFEEADNGPGILERRIPDPLTFRAVHRPDLLGGITLLQGKTDGRPLVAVPYYAWGHRETGKMAVWMTRIPSD